MSIRLGIAPIAWSNDDMPELGEKTSLEQCLKEASLAGFTVIESGGKFPLDSKILLPKLEKENLKLCSGWYGAQLLKRSPKEEFNLMSKQLKLFKDCKAPCMVFAEVTNSIQSDPIVPLSKRPKLEKDDWEKLIYSINGFVLINYYIYFFYFFPGHKCFVCAPDLPKRTNHHELKNMFGCGYFVQDS